MPDPRRMIAIAFGPPTMAEALAGLPSIRAEAECVELRLDLALLGPGPVQWVGGVALQHVGPDRPDVLGSTSGEDKGSNQPGHRNEKS